MKRTGALGSALGTALLATLFLRGAPAGPVASPQSGQPSSSRSALPQGANANKKKQKKWLPEDGPWKASRQHFAGARGGKECPALSLRSSSQPPPSAGNATVALADGQEIAIVNRREDLWCIPAGDDAVQAMIAIVPDPVHTHMTLVFDRAVEAIQLAADKMHYVIDQYWLPWDSEPNPQWVDYESRQKATIQEQEKQEQPGLLMFRWNGEAETKDGGDNRDHNTTASQTQSKVQILYVFLVSDTSTSGINGTQFSNAVDYAEDVLCANPKPSLPHCEKSSHIRIMGPSFSGSLASLRELAIQRRPEAFTAYSGTVSSATAIANQHFESLSPPLTFRSFVTDSESSISKLLSLLRDKREIDCDGHPEVAILSEAATTYGNVRLGRDKASATAPTQPCRYTRFSYPREISTLRNAYQRTGSDTSPSAGKNGDTGRPYLFLNLSDSTNSSDEPPDFSKQQAPLSKEAVLMQFAAEIRRDHYKYVGIIGSNVLDMMFLTDFLRKACPDTRLFVVNSDLLFERELDNAPYLGMLAVSTYPLLAPNLDWTNPGQELPRLPFSDQFEEGQYNATLVTIREIAANGIQAEPYEYQAPFEGDPQPFVPKSTQLPLWLTAVGTGGYWPIQLFPGDQRPSQDKDKNKNSSPALEPTLKSGDFSPAWKAVMTLLCIFAFLHITTLLTASPMKQFRDLAFVTTVPAQRLFFIHVSSAMLALALEMLATPAWRFGSYTSNYLQVIMLLVPIAMIGLVFACILLHANYLLRWRWEQRNGKNAEGRSAYITSHLASCCIWALAVVLGYCWWWPLFNDDPSHYGFFFAYRTVHLATGVSPFTPLLPLLAAVYAWTVFEVWRLRFNNQVRPILNTQPPFPGSATEGPIASAVNRYFLDRNYLITFSLIYIVWLFFFDPVHPFQLFEHRSFGWIYEVLFCLVMALMLSAGFRFGQIWSKLKDLLNELERSRIRLAFSRLKGFSWSPIWRPGGRSVEWVNMARSFEAIRYIATCSEEGDSKLKDVKALQKTIQDIQSKLSDIGLRLREGASWESVRPELENVRSAIEGVLAQLHSGHPTDSLQQKTDQVQSTFQDILQGLEGHGTKASIQFALLRIHSQLRAIHGTLELLEAPAATQEKIGDIIEVTAQLRGQKVFSPVIRTTHEYWRHTEAKNQDSVADTFYDLEKSFGEIQAVLATILNAVLDILQDHWTTQCPDLVEGEELEKDDKQVTVYCHPEEINAHEQHIRRLEEYVALRYVAFIRGALGHMRHLLIFLGLSFSLVLISLNIYSFEPHQSLIWSFTAIFAAIGFTVVVVLMQAHKDHILSRITGTTPNELGIAFYVRIISFGAAPLLTLLATHFPSIGRYLLSFLQPGLEALK